MTSRSDLTRPGGSGRLVGVWLAVTAVVLAIAPTAGAAGWMIQPVPPTGVPNGWLAGVSCSAPTACVAVGHTYDSSGATVTLAQRWNGTAWTVEPTPQPAVGSSPALAGVSCSSTRACTAVGSFAGLDESNPNNPQQLEVALALRWNGTGWSIQRPVSPVEVLGIPPGSELTGVSCPSASACDAVGSSPTGALAERWDAAGWSRPPNPAEQDDDVYADAPGAVSCVSARWCIAAGGSVFGVLVQRWNGRRFSLEPTPAVADAKFAELDGVSCPSATVCTAAGYSNNRRGGRATALVERWSARTAGWTITPTRNPAGAANSEFEAVSCVSSNICTAVGFAGATMLAARSS